MFILTFKPTFKATVQITVPGEDSRPLEVVFKHKTKTALQAFLDGPRGRSNADMLADMIDKVEGKPEGQSDADFLEQLTENFPAAANDILRTYLRELSESRVKN